jgi:hypothetical protein
MLMLLMDLTSQTTTTMLLYLIILEIHPTVMMMATVVHLCQHHQKLTMKTSSFHTIAQQCIWMLMVEVLLLLGG